MADYYPAHVAAEIFDKLDQYLWRLTYKWARFSHANKSASWVTARYFGKFNKARQDRWVFGDRQSGSYMHRFSWTSIVRHQLVKQGASPDDPTLADYWAERRREPVLPINNTSLWPAHMVPNVQLLINAMLDDVDWELDRRGHRFVPYADDGRVYVQSKRAGERVMESIAQYVEQHLKLKINHEKSVVGRAIRRPLLGSASSPAAGRSKSGPTRRLASGPRIASGS